MSIILGHIICKTETLKLLFANDWTIDQALADAPEITYKAFP